MASETLSTALALMFGHEGGYVNAKTDSGGPTKYGITHRMLAAHRGVKSVTAEQVKAMTKAEAEAIYRKDYWVQSGGDLLPTGLVGNAGSYAFITGREIAVGGQMLLVQLTSANNVVDIVTDDNTYPGADNAILKIAGTLPIANLV